MWSPGPTTSIWEIDVFSAENTGLIVAEIELRREDQEFDLPPWIGPEVTGQTPYYNSSLALRPFCDWSGLDRASGERRVGDTAARPVLQLNR
jgi:hypothetical protein